MKTKLFTILFSTFVAVSMAQTDHTYLLQKELDANFDKAFADLTEDQLSDMEGSAYENESFLLGNVYQHDKLVSKNLLLRYNAFSDEIEIKNNNDDKYSALLKNGDTYARILDDIYIFIPKDGSNQKGHYFKILTTGDHFELYSKTEATFRPPSFAKTSYDSDQPARITQNINYYLVSKKGDFYELPTSKSKIVKIMGLKKKEINTYIKKQRIHTDKESDLIKLVNYYNSIL